MATRYILPDVQQVGLIFKMAASIYVFGFLFIQKKIIKKKIKNGHSLHFT